MADKLGIQRGRAWHTEHGKKHGVSVKAAVSLLLVLLLCFSCSAEELINITLYHFSASNLPVGNVNVTLRDNANSTLASNLTDNSTGEASFYDINTTDYPLFNFLSRYPSSQYTAVLSNTSCPSSVRLNGFGSISVVVKNTLGQYLENQDGQVWVSEKDNPETVIMVYDTRCTYGGSYIDDLGNQVQVTDCPVSDSRGNYVYRFDVLEKDGFFYNENYTAHVVINGIEESCNFTTVLPRHADADKWAARGKSLGGFVFLLVFVYLFIKVIIKVLRRLK